MQSSLQELTAELSQLKADVNEKEKDAKKAQDDTEKEHKDAMNDMENKHKDAMDEKEKDAKKADEDKEKHDAVLKAVLKAMDENDKDKREALVKAAMVDHKDDQHTQTAKKGEYEEEKKAMKAQLEYQDKIIKTPKLQVLTAAYAKAGTEKTKLATYTAEWNSMTAQQLDAAIDKIQPLIGSFNIVQQEPLSPSQGLSSEFSGSINTNNEYSAKVDKMSTEELFA